MQLPKLPQLPSATGVLLGLILLIGVAFGSYWKGAQVTRNAMEAEQSKAIIAAEVKHAEEMASRAKQVTKIEEKGNVVRRRLEKEIQYVKVYSECVASPDAMRLLEDAYKGEAPEPSRDPQLPQTDASPGR